MYSIKLRAALTGWFCVSLLAIFIGCQPVAEGPQEAQKEVETEIKVEDTKEVKKEIKIDTPEGEVIATETEVEPIPQTVTVVEGDELARLRSLANAGPGFVAHYLPEAKTASLKDYDAAFRAWQIDPKRPYTDQQVVEIVGGYLGNKMIDDFEMEWVTITDEYGTEYGVRSKKVVTSCFPFSTVRKRIEDNAYDFVHPVYYMLKEVIENEKLAEQSPEK